LMRLLIVLMMSLKVQDKQMEESTFVDEEL
jgi:hypothetical protein